MQGEVECKVSSPRNSKLSRKKEKENTYSLKSSLLFQSFSFFPKEDTLLLVCFIYSTALQGKRVL